MTAMLETIQEMKFFLRTAFWDSKEFAGLTIEVKTQGLGQGNGASPAGWCNISIMILWAHGAKGHRAHFIAPMSHVRSSQSMILYVDDTDLLHLNMHRDETIFKMHAALQRRNQKLGQTAYCYGWYPKARKILFSSRRFPVDTARRLAVYWTP
jgi:hypothetical protein